MVRSGVAVKIPFTALPSVDFCGVFAYLGEEDRRWRKLLFFLIESHRRRCFDYENNYRMPV